MKKVSKKILLLAGACSLLAVACVWAYFQNSMPVTNPFSTGKANVYMDETFDVDDTWVPGEEKQKEVTFGNAGEVPVVIRARFLPELYLSDESKVTDASILAGFQLNFADSFAAEWEEHEDGWYYYKKVLEPDERTNLTLVSVTMNNNISNDVHGVRTDYSKARMDVDVICEAIQTTVSKDSSKLEAWDYYPQVNGTQVSWTKK
ncbi:BsaA family SipW-dependent biofilm matrix protein [Hespellia stercorisuis]|uniref:Alternate signal-mediated exported protein, CPF_0494 family n=1 Tax=Hespellia stercorisuis DSM 15480 TaxID=1121950 RepID=A0A1M6I922_9FIRM|nr:BsaA family SipW-dependent biofilm matrix protein [Hespellia stercorisuis]SHJ30947.1 alternate signal-mediated exported protein, CPF_0494 family [Hespellia stercorisuis DSM 15480]